MNLWWVSSLFFAAWWLGAWGLLTWRKALYLVPGERKEPPRTRLFIATVFLLLAAPVLLALALWIPSELHRFVSEDISRLDTWSGYLAVAMAVPIPQCLFGMLFTILLVRQDTTFIRGHTAHDKSIAVVQHLPWHVALAASTQAVLLLATRVGGDYGIFVTAGIMLLALWSAVKVRDALWRSSAGAPFPMDECPLKDEILAIARSAGCMTESVSVVPARLKKEGVEPSGYEYALQSWQSLQRLDPLKPVLPLALIQRVDPATITAALALYYVRSVKRRGGVTPIETKRTRRIRVSLMAAVLLIIMVSLQLAVGARSLAWALVSAGLALASATVWFRRHRALARKGNAWRYQEGCRLWCEAAPPGERDARAFVQSLARFSEWTLHHNPPEQIMAVYEARIGWLEFLDAAFPGGRKEGRAILRRALAERG